MSVKVIAAICGLVLFGSVAMAQITLDQSEVPSQVGDTFWYKYNSDTANVTPGAAGGPHTWVFDTSLYAGQVEDMRIVDKAGTPFAADFPDANVCYSQDGPGVMMYYYHGLFPTEYRSYGQGWQIFIPDTSFAQVYHPTCLTLPLPATMGTDWDSYYVWTDTANDTTWTVGTNSAHNVIDAWGTVQTPAGNFPCLRENSVRQFVMSTYVNGVPVYTDTSYSRSYYWLAEGVGWAVSMKSLMNDTTVNFTRSDCYTVLVSMNAGGIEEGRRPDASRLTPQALGPTLVRGVLYLPPASGVERDASCVLLDVSGRKVMDLAPGRNDLGRVAPGVYYVAGADRAVRRRLIVTR